MAGCNGKNESGEAAESIDFIGGRCGGIGRRARLKIWYSEECVGSTPSIGTINLPIARER